MENYLKSEKGFSLVYVVIISVILTASILIVLTFIGIHIRTISTKENFLKSKYLAEGGFYKFIHSLSAEGMFNISAPEKPVGIQMSGEDSSLIYSKNWGLYLLVTSQARKKNQQFAFQALVGQKMIPSFNPALIINPKFPALVLTGDARLDGDIITGLQGIKKGTISGKPFTGERLVNGNIFKTDQDERPPKNQFYIDKLLENCKSYLSRKDLIDISEFTTDTTSRLDFSQVDETEDKAVYITNEILNQRDWWIRGPVTLVSDQPLYIKNNISLENYVTLVCNKKLILEGNIRIKRTIIYSPDRISVNKVSSFEGQLFSENSIVIGQNISLDYPSVLLVNSELDTASIIISSHSEVSGSVILSSKFDSTKTFQNQSKIIIERNAKVNGLVYSDNFTTLEGQVNGIVITDRFYLYHSPTVYFNWIKDGVIDRNALSDKFRLPLFFKTSDTKLSPLFFE